MKAGAGSLLVVAVLLVACTGKDAPEGMTVVTTPDVGRIGVARMLVDRFARESRVPVRLIIREEHLIPALLDRGSAHVVLTLAPALLQELQRRRAVRLAQTIAYDDYLLVGPKRDPAGAKSAKTATEALRRIARRDRAFCAPVDVPDLRSREAMLWEASPSEPRDDSRYRVCRGSASEVLKEAARRGAYTLTDRATFEAGRHSGIAPLLQNTPLLHNDLVLVLLRTSDTNRSAEWFVEWVMSYRGRDAIDRYRFDDGRRFFVKER